MGWTLLRRTTLILVLALVLPLPVVLPQSAGTPGEVTTTVVADWGQDRLEVTVRGILTDRELDRPDGLARAEQRIRRSADALVLQSINLIPADSEHSVGELAVADAQLQQELSRIASAQQPRTVRPSRDLASLSLEYEIALAPIRSAVSRRLVSSDQVSRHWAWVPSDTFTGLLVYAADPLPRYSDPAAPSALLQPALTFSIYSSSGEPVVIPTGLGPEAAGPVYVSSLDERPITATIGLRPLRVLAREAFGVNPVDPVIGNSDANRLRALEANLEMLATGRIAVVVDSSLLRQELR